MAPIIGSRTDTPTFAADDEGNDTSKAVEECVAPSSATLAVPRPGLVASSSAPSLWRRADQDLLGNVNASCGFASARNTDVMQCYGTPPRSPLRRGFRHIRNSCGDENNGRGLSVGELRHIALGRQPLFTSSASTPAANVTGTSSDTKCREPLQNTRALLRTLRKASRTTLSEAPSHQQRPIVATIEEDLSDSDRDLSEGGGSVTHASVDEQRHTTLFGDDDGMPGRTQLRPSKSASGACRPSARRSPFVEYEAREKRLHAERKWLQEDALYMSRRTGDLRHDMIQKNLAQQNQSMLEAYDNSVFYTSYAVKLRASNRRHGTNLGGGSKIEQQLHAAAQIRIKANNFMNKPSLQHEGQEKKEGAATSKLKTLQHDLKVMLRTNDQDIGPRFYFESAKAS